MTKYGIASSSSPAHDTLANIVSSLRVSMPTNSVVMASDRESFSILGNVTETSNSLSLGFDEITILLYTAQPTLVILSLGVKLLEKDPTDLTTNTLLNFPVGENSVVDFMNNQLQVIIQAARNKALNEGKANYIFNLPNAARLDELAGIYGFETIGKPKIFTNISLVYMS